MYTVLDDYAAALSAPEEEHPILSAWELEEMERAMRSVDPTYNSPDYRDGHISPDDADSDSGIDWWREL